MRNINDFKKNYKERIEDIAKSKTEWIKDFVESQKPKDPVKTVADMYKEITSSKPLSIRHFDHKSDM